MKQYMKTLATTLMMGAVLYQPIQAATPEEMSELVSKLEHVSEPKTFTLCNYSGTRQGTQFGYRSDTERGWIFMTYSVEKDQCMLQLSKITETTQQQIILNYLIDTAVNGSEFDGILDHVWKQTFANIEEFQEWEAQYETDVCPFMVETRTSPSRGDETDQAFFDKMVTFLNASIKPDTPSPSDGKSQ